MTIKPSRLPVRDRDLISVVNFWSKNRSVWAYNLRMEADDVTQILWCELLHRWGRYDPSRGSITAWSVMVCRHTVIKLYHKYQRPKWGGKVAHCRETKVGGPLVEYLHEVPTSTPVTQEIRRTVRNAISDLPTEQSTLLRDRLDGLSVRAAAQERGMSRVALRRLECKALKGLEHRLTR